MIKPDIRLSIGFALVCAAPLAAQPEPVDNPSLPGVEYSLLELGPSPAVAERTPQHGPFWERRGPWAQQIERAVAVNGGDRSHPLATGWIDFDTYVRIEPGIVTYFNPLPGPTSGKDATHLCRISVNIERAGIVGPDSLQAINVARCAAPGASPFFARQRERHLRRGAGTMTARTALTAPDGETLFVEHRGGGIDNADNPVAVDATKNAIRAYYQFPARSSLGMGGVQRAWVIERADGTFDLAVRFDFLDSGSHSGCVLRDARGSFPIEGWITRELTLWCQEHDERYKASLPPEQRRG